MFERFARVTRPVHRDWLKDGEWAPYSGSVEDDPFIDSAYSEEVDPNEAEHSVVHARPSDFTNYAIRVVDQQKNRIIPFSFADRNYLRRPYDTSFKRILLKCGRQVEKCEFELSSVVLANGATVVIRDIQVGDRVAGLDPDGAHTAVGVVTWKSERYSKPCIRVRTRQGHETTIARTHPMRTWGAWTEGGELQAKSRLAVARQAGEFTGDTGLHDDWVVLAGAMIAEGGCTGTPNFSQQDNELLEDVLDICARRGIVYEPHKKGSCWGLNFIQSERGVDSPVTEKLKEWCLYGTNSFTKFVPDFVYDLDIYQTALFLNRLWAGDGHCSLQEIGRAHV